MVDLPRSVWVSTDDGRRLPGWCQAVRRDDAGWMGFVAYTDRDAGLQYLTWMSEGQLACRPPVTWSGSLDLPWRA
jgi:hypothetical protein